MTGRIFQRVIWVGTVAVVAIVLAAAIMYLRVQFLSDASSARQTALASMLSLSAIAAVLMVVVPSVSRRAAQDVRRREERLLTTLSSIGDGVIATDANCAIRFVNRVASELTGWSQPEAEGRPLAEVFKVVGADNRLPAESPAAQVLREPSQSVFSKGNLVLIGSELGARSQDQTGGLREDGGCRTGQGHRDPRCDLEAADHCGNG